MKNHKVQTIAPDGWFGEYDPEMIERGVVRGRELQAEAIRNAFKSLFGFGAKKQPKPADHPAPRGGLAQACAKVIP